MIKKILNTESNWGALVARLTLGIVLFPHGAQKMLGWFGGYGFTATLDAFTQQMNLPWLVAFAVRFAGRRSETRERLPRYLEPAGEHNAAI